MRSRLMVPFFVALLLGSVLMVPLPVLAEPSLIASNPLIVNPEPDWSLFWQKFNALSSWNLEYYDTSTSTWVSCKSDLQIVRDYPTPNQVKLTLVFDASHNAAYRLTFGINKAVREYVTKLDSYQYELNYENYSLVWDWSDAISIPGLVFTHGLQNDMFWFRMSRDNVPLGAHVVIDPSIIASYTAAADTYETIKDLHPSDSASYSAIGQSFQNGLANANLTIASFRVLKTSTPDGSSYAVLYTHSGVYGTSSEPTGAALATSDPINVNTFGAGYAYVNYTFTGAQRYEMTANAYYCIVLVGPSVGTIDGTNYVRVASDSTTPTAPGNVVRYANGAWGHDDTRDIQFYVYGNAGAPTNDACVSTATFSRNVDSWVNVTVSDADLVADFTTVDIQVIMLDAKNFTLRWTQATDTFSEVSDPDGVCTLSADAVKENVDSDTAKVAFKFKITGGADGLCSVTVTTTDDYALTDVDIYADEFTYQTYGWTPTGDIIGSLFDWWYGTTFGILAMLQVYILGLMAYLGGAFTNMLTLVVQIFRVVNGTFTFFVDWFTRIISFFITLFTYVVAILNGTQTGIGTLVDIWTFFEVTTWIDFIPVVIAIMWFESLDKRGSTQGWVNALVSDLNIVIGFASFFMQMFGFIIDTVFNLVMTLMDAVPLV